MSVQPRTPPSPSQQALSELIPKSHSPPVTEALMTPAHSVNGNMASVAIFDLPQVREEASQKRKRSIDVQGDRDSKKVHVEDSRSAIDDLHFDVGKKYMLCKTPHSHVKPDPTHDLFAEFELTAIAASVARETATGQKQAIRKTYKGHMKTLGIAGRFDADRKEAGDPESLFTMISKPDDYWNMEMGSADDAEMAFPQNVLDALSKATTMHRGTIKQDQWNSDVLGEVGKIAAAPPAVPAHKVGFAATRAPPVGAVAARAVHPEAVRAKRNIRKRSYADSSFEGYDETFADDMLDDGSVSTGEGDGFRKKTNKSSISMPTQRQYSYGPGMVGA